MTDNTPPACRPSQAYQAAEAVRQMPRDLWGGTSAMRDAGTRYLPLHEGETSASREYQRRVASSYLWPAFRRAVQNLVGKVFGKPLDLGKDVPADLARWAEDVDRRTNNLHSFARTLFTDAWIDGVGFVLVDYSPGPSGASREDDRQMGRRPWLVRYRAGELINWRVDHVNGVARLGLAVLREQGTDTEGEFGEVEVTRCRVFLLDDTGAVQYEAWTRRGGDGKDWALTEPRRPLLIGGEVAREIPLVDVYADPLEAGLWGSATPPLDGLAWLNVRDWQKQSDLDNIEHTANVPVVIFPGMSAEDLKALPWGPTTALATAAGEKPFYLEHTGACIGELKTSIAEGRELMRQLSMEPLVPRTGQATATAEAIRGAEAQSLLLASALGLQDRLEQCLRWMARFERLGDDAGGSVTVNTKFQTSPIEAADLDALNKARDRRDLSRDTYWGEMRRRGVLGDDFDPDAEAELLDREAPETGRESAMAMRVAELIRGGMDPDAAMAAAAGEDGDGEVAA